RDAVAKHGSQIERRTSLRLPGVDISTFRQQEANLGLIMDGPVQWRRAAAVFCVHVGALVDEQLYIGERPIAGGVMQGCRTAVILSLNHLWTGGDLPLDLRAISGTHRCDQRCDFGVYWTARLLCDDICAKFCSLVDPGAQQPDFIVGERPCRRHLQSAVAVHHAADQLACGAVSDFDYWAVVAPAQGILTQVKPQAGLLNVRPVAGVTFPSEQRLDVLFIVNFPGGGWW